MQEMVKKKDKYGLTYRIVNKMTMLHYLTPTGMSDLEYCETGRLFYINKLMPNHGKTTALTVIGRFEHTVIEQFYKLTNDRLERIRLFRE